MANLSFEKVETGRTHNVTDKGVQPITDEAGNPEAVYTLFAELDGVKYPIASYPATSVDDFVARAKASQQQDQSAADESDDTSGQSQA